MTTAFPWSDDLDKRHEWLEGLGLPSKCKCGLEWGQYTRRLETESMDDGAIIREFPVYVVRTLSCSHSHHHRWVEYPDGTPMPEGAAAAVLQREDEQQGRTGVC